MGFLFKPFTDQYNEAPNVGQVIVMMAVWPIFVGYAAYCILEYNDFITAEKIHEMDEMHKIEERSTDEPTDEPTDEMPVLQN